MTQTASTGECLLREARKFFSPTWPWSCVYVPPGAERRSKTKAWLRSTVVLLGKLCPTHAYPQPLCAHCVPVAEIEMIEIRKKTIRSVLISAKELPVEHQIRASIVVRHISRSMKVIFWGTFGITFWPFFCVSDTSPIIPEWYIYHLREAV